MAERLDIPDPDSPEFRELFSSSVTHAQWREVATSPNGLTMAELEERLPELAVQTHFSRRFRDGYKVFDVEQTREGRHVRYRIAGRRKEAAQTARVSPRVRARVLFRDGSRCQMCGASPAKDPDVQLEVDHRIPLHLNGTNDEDNLWTLCRTDNQGKRAFFASVEEHADKLRQAMHHEEVHRRIGEMFRAFGLNEPVPAYVLEIAASAKQFQDDWQRRLRELRELDWDYEVDKRREAGRVVSYYRLTADGGWPATGTIREELNRRRGRAA